MMDGGVGGGAVVAVSAGGLSWLISLELCANLAPT